jgi:TatD DNase family protein
MASVINIHTHIPQEGKFLLNVHQNFEHTDHSTCVSLGLHPWHLEAGHESWNQLRELASRDNVLAIGECGLDKLADTNWEQQEHWLHKQILLANQVGKPLIIHCVRAYQECIAMLKEAQVPVLIHGFNKNLSLAHSLLKQGYFLSIGKAIFNPHFTATFEQLPIEQLFFETDNEVGLTVMEVYKRAAELKNIALESLILQLDINFQKVFKHAR